MLKSRMVRFAALLGVVAAMAGLIGAAVIGTGAYFTDSHGGQISGYNGTVAITTSGGSGGDHLNFDFSGILPGAPGKTASISVKNTGSATQDIYLVFSNDNEMWSAVNDLGQYGKFVINGKTYDNLNNKYAAPDPGVPGTGTGSYMTGSCSTVERVPANYLPHLISLGSLAAGATRSFTINFQYIGCMTDHQGEALFNAATSDGFDPAITPAPLVYSVAAFQHGVAPDDPFNGAGAISPLVLPVTNDTRSPLGTFQ